MTRKAIINKLIIVTLEEENTINNNQYNPNNYNQYQYGNGQPLPPDPNAYYPKPYDPNDAPMTLGNWITTFLLLLIPLANLVLPFVWAFGSNVNKSKKTFFQAYLIFMLFYVVLYFVLIAAIIYLGVFASLQESFTDSLTILKFF